jgi:hypothetical protein
MPGEVRPDDYDQFLECATCGWICPLFAAEKEAEIRNQIETVESPYDNKLVVDSAHKRRTKKKVTRHINKKIKSTNDPDIAREIRQHGEQNVRVITDTNP